MPTVECAVPLFAYQSRPELVQISLVFPEFALQGTLPATLRVY